MIEKVLSQIIVLILVAIAGVAAFSTDSNGHAACSAQHSVQTCIHILRG